MKPLIDALKIVTQEDIELAKKPPVRAADGSSADEADPGKLMDLLGDIDGLKYEIHERMRRIEAVKQAKSVLLEDAERTDALNKRLAEIGKAMSVAHVGVLGAEEGREDAEPPRMQAREVVALPWPKVEETLDLPEGANGETVAQVAGNAPTGGVATQVLAEAGNAAFEAALERLEEFEQTRMQIWNQADEAARHQLEAATSLLNAAMTREEQASADFHSTEQALVAAYQRTNHRLEEAEQARTHAWAQTFDSVEEAKRRLEEAEQSRTQAWAQTFDGAEEAKRRLVEATAQLNAAVSREEQAAKELQSAKTALSNAYQSATERLEEAENSWKGTDLATQDAKRLLEQSAAELVVAREKEEKIAANLQSVRQEFAMAYQSASERLKEAEQFWQRGDSAAKEAQHLVDQSTAELLKARSAEETAAADLLSARQELTTAYQFAAVAAQRRLDAIESFHKAARWTVYAVALSWIAMAWMAWFAFHSNVPVWAPAAITLIILLVVFVSNKQRTHEA